MNYRFTLVLFLFLSFHYSRAQKSFEQGYLLISDNDTLRGYIDYKHWSRNPKTIRFKSSPEEKAKTYGLAELEGFHVHGESYIKAEVDINVSSSKVDALSYEPLPKLEKTLAFLLIINNGPKSLFHLISKENKTQLYISDKPGTYQLLIHHKYLTNNGSGQVVNADYYKKQLKDFFSDCEGLISDNALLPYSPHPIGKVFDKFYEKCQAAQPVKSYNRDDTQYQLGVLAGISHSKLDFKGVYTPEIINADFSKSNNFAGGIFFNIIIPRLKQRFSLYNELAFTSYKSSLTNQMDYSDNSYIRYTNTLGYGYIKLTNMVRYYIPAGSFQLFLNAGLSNALAISETNERVTESQFQNSDPVISKNVVFGATRKYELGLVFGLGAGYKKLGMELRHESTKGMSTFQALKSPVQRFYFLVSYRLK